MSARSGAVHESKQWCAGATSDNAACGGAELAGGWVRCAGEGVLVCSQLMGLLRQRGAHAFRQGIRRPGAFRK